MAGRGVLFALREDQVQRLLDAEDDEQVMELVEEIEATSDERDLEDTDKAWDAIHRCLSDGRLVFIAGSYPLNRCILGGKQLYAGDDYIVAFVASAEVRDVAVALAGVTREWFREHYFRLTDTDYPSGYIGEQDFEYSWQELELVKDFYRRAAAANQAVIFTVDS